MAYIEAYCNQCATYQRIRLLRVFPFGQCTVCNGPVGEQILSELFDQNPKARKAIDVVEKPLTVERPSKGQLNEATE
jgi:hypothetical protein